MTPIGFHRVSLLPNHYPKVVNADFAKPGAYHAPSFTFKYDVQVKDFEGVVC